jgi:hypothetical protein
MTTGDGLRYTALLHQVRRPAGPFRVLVRFDGQVLTDRTNEQTALAETM